MSETSELKEALNRIRAEIAKVIIGQERVIDLALVTIFARSHALLEGVPGVAKTLLVRTLGKVMDCEFKRIQFTPDLMPTDISGTNVFNLQNNEFTLMKGPVFTTFLLADEINRAPAKTQSALLQCMQERKVTIDGKDYELSADFTVFATQNPIEYEGTYPLPEAQKDRFLLKIIMDYPEEEEEKQLANSMLSGETPEHALATGQVEPVLNGETLVAVREQFRNIIVKNELVDYVVKIIRATRSHSAVLTGAGPRATQALIMGCRIYAALAGRDFVTPDDIKYLAYPVLGHRLILRPEFEIEGLSIEEVLEQILEEIAVPR